MLVSSPADSAGMLGSHFKVEELNNLGARIPDAIIMSVGNPNSSTGPAHFYLRHVQSLYIEYVDPMKSDQYIRFRNQPGGAEYKKGTTRLYYSSQNTLQSIIDEGYAIYLGGSGSEPSTSRVGQLQEVIDNIPLASSVELPDAILDYDLGSSTVSRILFFEKVQNSDHFQYKNQDGARYIRFHGTTGSVTLKHSSSNGDFGSIQEYISNGRALYYGGASSLTAQENEQIKLFLQHWEIDSSGNLRPKVHNTVDIGSAEQKVRDIYEHDA